MRVAFCVVGCRDRERDRGKRERARERERERERERGGERDRREREEKRRFVSKGLVSRRLAASSPTLAVTLWPPRWASHHVAPTRLRMVVSGVDHRHPVT